MKVMAIGTLDAPLTSEQRQQILPNEVSHTLKLYLDGKIEQFWFRQGTGPIFLMNLIRSKKPKRQSMTCRS